VDDAFQPTFTTFFEAGYRTELTILKALSIGLGLPEQTLGQLHADQTNELRITHYPAVARGDFVHSTRIAAHTDFGTITLLFQDAVGGLREFFSFFFLSFLKFLLAIGFVMLLR
jgi:isopenicillin N synthase-like dioxygenase